MNSNSSKRQRVRLLLLMFSLSLFPVIFFYFSPAIPFIAASKGIINGSLIIFSILFISSLFLGRAWCGWLCSGGGTQAICATIQPKRISIKWLRHIKYVIYVFWFSGIFILLYSTDKFLQIDFFFNTVNGVSVSSPKIFFTYYTVLLIISGLALIFGRGAACNMLCMMAPTMVIGEAISRFIRLPRLRIMTDKDSCTNCKICDTICPNSIEVSTEISKGEIKDIECKKCMACVDNCPKNALNIQFKGGK